MVLKNKLKPFNPFYKQYDNPLEDLKKYPILQILLTKSI